MQPLPQPSGNLLTRILAFILSAALLVAGLMFSLVFLAIAAVAGKLDYNVLQDGCFGG